MKRWVVGGIAVLVASLAASTVYAAPASILHNGVPLSLDPPGVMEHGTLLVPMAAFGRSIGMEVVQSGDRLSLRWSGGQMQTDADLYPFRHGVPYAGIDTLVGWSGGEVHRIGDVWHVETIPAALTGIEATPQRVVLRFDGFVPIQVEPPSGGELRLRIDHCRLGIAPRVFLLGEGGVEAVRLPVDTDGRIEVRIALAEGSSFQTQTHQSPGHYAYALVPAERPGSESVIRLDERRSLHTLATVLSDETVHADWIRVEGWRDRYRLTPAVAPFGRETLVSLEAIADAVGADVAVFLGCGDSSRPLDLLVVDGTPQVVGQGVHEGLTLDLFGRWSSFSSTAAIQARHRGRCVPIDDVNRPLLYGEAVAYSTGYMGTTARGVPGSFRVVKLRDKRVVSVYEGPFVAADPTATLLVASGEAKGGFASIGLGDTVELECVLEAGGEPLVHAFTAGPVLYQDGVPIVVPEDDGSTSPPAWAVVATDWHGALTVLRFHRAAGSERDVVADLLSLLERMPAPVRDAIVVARCGEVSLFARDRFGGTRRGGSEPGAVALCLVPLAR